MKSKELKLFEGIGRIDDKIIDEANSVKRKGLTVMKWIAIAACLALVLGIGGFTLHRAELNKLPIIDFEEMSVGMGFESYLLNDINDLVSANPIAVYDVPRRLPVYTNKITYSYPDHISLGADYDAMVKILTEYAQKLGITDYVIESDEPNEERKQNIVKYLSPEGQELASMEHFNLNNVWINTDEIEIQVDIYLRVTVTYKNGIELPEDISFGRYSSFEELSEAAEYIKDEFAFYLEDMKKPTANIYGGAYLFEGPSYDLEFFDNSGSEVDRMVNYSFKTVSFTPNSDGKLWIVRINPEINGDKLGNYPTISYEEAEKMLYEGKYLTTVMDYAVTENSVIEKAELVYRTSVEESTFLPYYKFYIDIEQEQDGMKKYCAFYVPAISPEYLGEVEIWDGTFN